MKPLIQYVYSCTNAFFNYLKNENLDALINELERIQKDADENIGGKDFTLWFKFFDNDTGATDIGEIKNDLSLPAKHSNRLYMLDKFMICTKDINPKNELQVYYS